MKKLNKHKKKEGLQKLALTLLMTAALSVPAFAASSDVAPRSKVLLTGNVLTVGDVFDGVTHDAHHVLAPAPAYGSTLMLSPQDLLRISNAFNLGWYPNGAESVVVRRDTQDIDSYEIETAVRDALESSVTGQRFDVDLNDRNVTIHLPGGSDAALQLADLKYDLAKGEFRATAMAGRERRDITGRFFPMTQVPVLSRPMRSGDVIGSGDIQYIDMRSGDVSSSLVVSAEKLIGQTPRRGVAALKPISAADVVLPPAVKKGELVTMTLQNSIIQLTAQGRAMQNATVGDVIRVINTSSNQTIEAVVTGDRTVMVRPPSEALVNVPVRTADRNG